MIDRVAQDEPFLEETLVQVGAGAGSGGGQGLSRGKEGALRNWRRGEGLDGVQQRLGGW